MNHPIHHVKKMMHILQHHSISEHKHWPIGPIIFYFIALIYLLAFIFYGGDMRIDFLITTMICAIFAFILGEFIVKMID
jgi:uncharacterized membrane-anchored protein YitT (DUF2179 family)